MATALLLEDEPLISMDLEATLADAGFAVVPVMTCTDALVWLNSNTPDVVIVDIILRDGPSDAVVDKLISSDCQLCADEHAGIPRLGIGPP